MSARTMIGVAIAAAAIELATPAHADDQDDAIFATILKDDGLLWV